jgi:hypothetical protein
MARLHRAGLDMFPEAALGCYLGRDGKVAPASNDALAKMNRQLHRSMVSTQSTDAEHRAEKKQQLSDEDWSEGAPHVHVSAPLK